MIRPHPPIHPLDASLATWLGRPPMSGLAAEAVSPTPYAALAAPASDAFRRKQAIHVSGVVIIFYWRIIFPSMYSGMAMRGVFENSNVSNEELAAFDAQEAKPYVPPKRARGRQQLHYMLDPLLEGYQEDNITNVPIPAWLVNTYWQEDARMGILGGIAFWQMVRKLCDVRSE